MKTFVKRDILGTIKSLTKLMKLDLNNNKYHKMEVKIGIANSLPLVKLRVSERQKIKFRDECQNFFIGFASNLRKQSSLKYRLTRAIPALDPHELLSKCNLARERMSNLLSFFRKSKLIKADICDSLVCNLKTFVNVLLANKRMNSKRLIG